MMGFPKKNEKTKNGLIILDNLRIYLLEFRF